LAVKIGYLLPTRENTMHGRPETRPLLALAEKAEDLGFDSIWAGDSITARPRHDPITLLTAVAARTGRVELGTAVLVPALRNPVRVILGVGLGIDTPSVHAEFEAAGVPFDKRVGRMLEGLRLCRALWTETAVDWDGRWRLRGVDLGPKPARPGGPPIWTAGSSPAGLKRLARNFDGWLPSGPRDVATWRRHWKTVQEETRAAGRDPANITGAMYVTIAVDDDAKTAERRMTDYLTEYYGPVAEHYLQHEACYAGSLEGAAEWLSRFVAAGASHLVMRFAGDHDQQLEAFARARELIGG
jgi:alkanesulfonate monooxygenase SsuD/methylene tetrahydromethanopterin reductase-like flavin-dependent oxidoreductase (luciferase family)